MPSVSGQIVAIIVGGLLGRWMLKIVPASGQTAGGYPVSRRTGMVALVLLALPLVLLPLSAVASGTFLGRAAGGCVPRWRPGLRWRPCRAAVAADCGCPKRHGEHRGSARRVRCGAGGAGPSLLLCGFPEAVAEGRYVAGQAALCCCWPLSYQPFLRSRGGVRAAVLGVPAPPQGSPSFVAGVNAGVVGILLATLYELMWTSAINADGMSRSRCLHLGYWSSRAHRRSWWCCWPT